MAPSKSTLARSRSSSNSKSRPLSRSASPKSSRTRSRSGTKESAACRSRTRSPSAPKSGYRSRSASRASASKTESKRRTAPKAGSRGRITVSQKSVDKIKRPVVISKATKPARRMTAYNLFVREQMPNHSGTSSRDAFAAIADSWKKMSQSEKDRYKTKTTQGTKDKSNGSPKDAPNLSDASSDPKESE